MAASILPSVHNKETISPKAAISGRAGSVHGATDDLGEAGAVRHPMQHDFGEGFRSVERNVSTLLAGLVGVQTTRRQSLLQPFDVFLRGDDNRRIAGTESRADKIAQRLKQRI